MAGSKYAYVRAFEADDSLLPAVWIVVRVDGRGFTKFSELHGFEKPNDKPALDLMDAAAKAVLCEFPDVCLAYGESDEYSFVLHKDCQLYGRRSSKLVSTITSCFTGSYVRLWAQVMPPGRALAATPVFDGRAVCYPSLAILRDYLAWRQADTHVNNQYNTCYWALVKGGRSPAEAQAAVKGSDAAFKNDLLFTQFGINYAQLPEQFRKGSVVLRLPVEAVAKLRDDGTPVLRRRREVTVLHCDIIGDARGRQAAASAAAPDAAGLLKALAQLASSSTIVVGGHQAWALLEALEPLLPEQLAGVAPDVVASGVWAMSRLHLSPSDAAVDVNFFMLRAPGFWAAAAGAALPHLRAMRPAGVSNLLQGVAASGWQAACGRGDGAAGSGSGDQAAVSALLRGVEALLLAEPGRLGRWRMRDISQLCQAFALTGYNCTLLFAAVAGHLLDAPPPVSTGRSAPPGAAGGAARAPAPAAAAAAPWNVQSHALGAPPRRDKHAKGRGPARLAACRPADAVGLAWAYVAAFCPNRLLLAELAPVVAAHAGQLHAADVSRLLWAYATAGVCDAAMLAAVTSATAEEMHAVLPRTAAGAVWSLARLGYEAPAFMEAALDRLAECLDAENAAAGAGAGRGASASGGRGGAGGSGARPPATAAGGLPAAGGSAAGAAGAGPSVLQRLLDSPPPELLSGGPEAASNARGELSRLGMLAQGRPRRVRQRQADAGPAQEPAQEPARGVDAQDPRDASASGDGDGGGGAALQAAAAAGEGVRVSPRDAAQAAHACGALPHYNGAFFGALRRALPRLLPGLRDAELAETLWGLATLRLYDGPNMDAAAAELLRRAPQLPPAPLALAAWSFASLRHRDAALLEALAARGTALARGGSLTPLDAVQLVRSAAKLGFRDERLFRSASEVLLGARPRVGNSLMVSALWAFAVGGVFDGALFATGFAQLADLPPARARPLLLLQLFQAATLMQDAFRGAGVAPPAVLPPGLAAAAARAWLSSSRRSAGRASGFQAAVAAALAGEGLRLDVSSEALTADGLFTIDAAVTWRGRRVAVEVDGPEHFTSNAPHALLGSSLAKQRCLQARGWVVLSVPFHEWNRLAGGGRAGSAGLAAARAAYLAAALDAAVTLADVPSGLQQPLAATGAELLPLLALLALLVSTAGAADAGAPPPLVLLEGVSAARALRYSWSVETATRPSGLSLRLGGAGGSLEVSTNYTRAAAGPAGVVSGVVRLVSASDAPLSLAGVQVLVTGAVQPLPQRVAAQCARAPGGGVELPARGALACPFALVLPGAGGGALSLVGQAVLHSGASVSSLPAAATLPPVGGAPSGAAPPLELGRCAALSDGFQRGGLFLAPGAVDGGAKQPSAGESACAPAVRRTYRLRFGPYAPGMACGTYKVSNVARANPLGGDAPPRQASSLVLVSVTGCADAPPPPPAAPPASPGAWAVGGESVIFGAPAPPRGPPPLALPAPAPQPGELPAAAAALPPPPVPDAAGRARPDYYYTYEYEATLPQRRRQLLHAPGAAGGAPQPPHAPQRGADLGQQQQTQLQQPGDASAVPAPALAGLDWAALAGEAASGYGLGGREALGLPAQPERLELVGAGLAPQAQQPPAARPRDAELRWGDALPPLVNAADREERWALRRRRLLQAAAAAAGGSAAPQPGYGATYYSSAPPRPAGPDAPSLALVNVRADGGVPSYAWSAAVAVDPPALRLGPGGGAALRYAVRVTRSPLLPRTLLRGWLVVSNPSDAPLKLAEVVAEVPAAGLAAWAHAPAACAAPAGAGPAGGAVSVPPRGKVACAFSLTYPGLAPDEGVLFGRAVTAAGGELLSEGLAFSRPPAPAGGPPPALGRCALVSDTFLTPDDSPTALAPAEAPGKAPPAASASVPGARGGALVCGSAAYAYNVTLGPLAQCGEFQVVNVVRLHPLNGSALPPASAAARVPVEVTGCPLAGGLAAGQPLSGAAVARDAAALSNAGAGGAGLALPVLALQVLASRNATSHAWSVTAAPVATGAPAAQSYAAPLRADVLVSYRRAPAPPGLALRGNVTLRNPNLLDGLALAQVQCPRDGAGVVLVPGQLVGGGALACSWALEVEAAGPLGGLLAPGAGAVLTAYAVTAAGREAASPPLPLSGVPRDGPGGPGGACAALSASFALRGPGGARLPLRRRPAGGGGAADLLPGEGGGGRAGDVVCDSITLSYAATYDPPGDRACGTYTVEHTALASPVTGAAPLGAAAASVGIEVGGCPGAAAQVRLGGLELRSLTRVAWNVSGQASAAAGGAVVGAVGSTADVAVGLRYDAQPLAPELQLAGVVTVRALGGAPLALAGVLVDALPAGGAGLAGLAGAPLATWAAACPGLPGPGGVGGPVLLAPNGSAACGFAGPVPPSLAGAAALVARLQLADGSELASPAAGFDFSAPPAAHESAGRCAVVGDHFLAGPGLVAPARSSRPAGAGAGALVCGSQSGMLAARGAGPRLARAARGRPAALRALPVHLPDLPLIERQLEEQVVIEGLFHVTAVQAGSCMERFGGDLRELAPAAPALAAADARGARQRDLLVDEAVCLATPSESPSDQPSRRPAGLVEHAARALRRGAPPDVAVAEAQAERVALAELYTAEVLQASAALRRQRRRAYVRALRAGRETVQAALSSLASLDGAT
ncbi:rgt-1 [Scenedesmus sp. PABB004]|nr:rgt-1 [Scenedesmus sp. PABB004]